MNNEHTWLICNNDDVILFEKDTFKVSRLRDLIKTEITNKFNQCIYNQETQAVGISLNSLFSKVSANQDNIQINEIQIHSIKVCQILRIDGKGWQKGNLKILVNKSIVDNNLKVYLEFSADKSNEPESPLDDIRKIMNTSIS